MKYFIARDSRPLDERGLGPLYLFTEKPDRGLNVWNPLDDEDWYCENVQLDRTLFPELKWEDEPIEVELAIKRAMGTSTKAVPEEETGLSFSYDETTMTASVNALENMEVDSVTIPSKVLYEGKEYDVTKIGDYAFAYCTSLTSIVIPESVTTIGEYAFEDCSGLTSIVVDKDNKVYDSRNNCNAIIETKSNTLVRGCQNTVIPNSVTTIGKYAFYNCTSLTSIEIPKSVTEIGYAAFAYCSSLTSIEIPNSVTEIGGYAFNGCTSLTSIVADKDNKVYDSRNNCNAIIETASNTLIVGCQNTVIPNSVTTIGKYAFYNCTSLTSIEIPKSVTTIGESAFESCTSLTSIEIPKSVTTIKSGAFDGCENLKTARVPKGCEIADDAFPPTCKNRKILKI